MTAIEAITARGSVRNYRDRDTPVPQEQIDALLEAAMKAPSACNTRPWTFVVVRSREKLDALAAAHPYAKMLSGCPLAVIVAALPGVQAGIAEGFFPQDCGAATQNILLAAAELGLGTCWCGVYPKEETMNAVRGILGDALAAGAVPFNVIAVGHPAGKSGSRGRYEKEKVTYL